MDWGYQFATAEQCARPLPGVRGLFNEIVVRPRVKSEDIARQITAALTRQALREARHIAIEVEGGVVTLSGKVHSRAEHDAMSNLRPSMVNLAFLWLFTWLIPLRVLKRRNSSLPDSSG